MLWSEFQFQSNHLDKIYKNNNNTLKFIFIVVSYTNRYLKVSTYRYKVYDTYFNFSKPTTNLLCHNFKKDNCFYYTIIIKNQIFWGHWSRWNTIANILSLYNKKHDSKILLKRHYQIVYYMGTYIIIYKNKCPHITYLN